MIVLYCIVCCIELHLIHLQGGRKMTFSTVLVFLVIGLIIMALGAWRRNRWIIVLSMAPFLVGIWGIYSIFLSGV